ncbi:MAG: VCBS repeat-containing protein, partial [Bacteroidota bacterium]|nr:VCBS repeat-containing protein [Bacteroidota bacterium]
YFAHWSAPLGDINHDGYDDFAIATGSDTTFIFFGGDPIDHEPAYFLYGGGAGINAGDFNGDGLADLVTARKCQHPGLPCPENRGQVRIYYQRSSGRAFGPEADLVIEGMPGEYTGAYMDAIRPTVQVLDFNGDDFDDFVAPANAFADSVDFKAVLYLGGAEMDAQVDLEFTAAPRNTPSDHFYRDVLAGDLNGDGCDDLLIQGHTALDGKRNSYWHLYFGRRNPQPMGPDRVLQEVGGWAPAFILSAIMDVDGDGYADIIDAGSESLHRERGDVLMFRSGPVLPDIIRPNDSIPNPDPDPLMFLWPQNASPVGDMNGDGTPDLMIPWSTYFYPGSSAYFFHPGGPEFRAPTGYGGTVPEQDHVWPGMYDAGDVNGDGYRDVLALGRATRKGYKSNRFQIRLGSGKLSTATGEVPVPSDARLLLSPNPLPAGSAQITAQATGLQPGRAQLLLRDMLGRELHTAAVEVNGNSVTRVLDVSTLAPGAYVITLRQKGTILTGKMLVR